MNTRIIALTCALTATACGCAESEPAQAAAARRRAPPPAEPSTAANAPGAPAADNTTLNKRDRVSSALTPTDQGNSGSETAVSAAIRRGIMEDKNLSFAAKNVKIITVGTRVTLRGPVRTEQERAAIEALAKRTAGVSEVDNQLELKN